MGVPDREQRHSGDDKDKLGRRADRDVDHHAGRGLRPWDAPLMRESRAYDVASDASHRQQRADRFADPTHPKEAEDAGTFQSRKQLSPGDRVQIEWREMKQRYWQ